MEWVYIATCPCVAVSQVVNQLQVSLVNLAYIAIDHYPVEL